MTLSLGIFNSHPAPLIEWRIRLVLARLLKSRNHPGSARTEFVRAGALIQHLTANIEDHRLREVFLSTEAVREVLACAAEK